MDLIFILVLVALCVVSCWLIGAFTGIGGPK
jgi:hypothetical protein